MTDSKTFSDSNVIQDLAEFLSTICEADTNTIVEFYDDALNMHCLLKSNAENREKPEQNNCQVDEKKII